MNKLYRSLLVFEVLDHFWAHVKRRSRLVAGDAKLPDKKTLATNRPRFQEKLMDSYSLVNFINGRVAWCSFDVDRVGCLQFPNRV